MGVHFQINDSARARESSAVTAVNTLGLYYRCIDGNRIVCCIDKTWHRFIKHELTPETTQRANTQ